MNARGSAAEAHRLVERGHAYLDVRSEEEFGLGHPEGAYNVPLLIHAAGELTPNPHFLAVVRACFGLDQPLIVGCERGERSRQAAAQLVSHGHREVVECAAGFGGVRDPFGRVIEVGWRGAGLPCAFEPRKDRDYPALLARAGVTR